MRVDGGEQLCYQLAGGGKNGGRIQMRLVDSHAHLDMKQYAPGEVEALLSGEGYSSYCEEEAG